MNLNHELTVTIKVSDIIETLKKNREDHINEYEQAVEKYFLSVQKRLKDFLKSAKKKEDRSFNVGLTPPIDRTADYDKLISMFSYAQNETVELTQADIDQLLNDEFTWAKAAKMSNSFYNNANTVFASAMSAY